jgi:uncharacterized protein (TIGR02271 family)
MFENQPGTADAKNKGWVGKMAFDANREKIGTITVHNMQAGYFVAQKGMLFPHDVYIPVGAVTRADASSVYLNLTNDQLRDERYKAAATATGATAAAATGTARANLRSVADETPVRKADDRVERPVVEKPVVEKPVVEKPVVEKPVVEKPVADRPAREATTAYGRYQEVEDITVPLREETLTANRTREQIGNVRVHRYVVQENETIEAPVSHEEVTIEHVARTDLPVGADVFTDKDVDVPVMGERLTLGKQTHVAEEVHIHKRLVTEQQHASDTVRREQIRVEGNAEDVETRGTIPPSQDASPRGDPLR